MTGYDRGGDEDQQKRWEENPDGRDDRAPETRHQVADKRRRDHNRTRTDHAHRDTDQELPFVHPAVFGDQSLLKKGNDHQAAAKGEGAGLEEEEPKLHHNRTARRNWRRGSDGWNDGHGGSSQECRRGLLPPKQTILIPATPGPRGAKQKRRLRFKYDSIARP